ncbi:hypothetical protein BDF21DRAFT_485892 [Thamnidium elegans]|nr:hypothetical protein BDF21DRAFT_485892 [Thamnidium elegans]
MTNMPFEFGIARSEKLVGAAQAEVIMLCLFLLVVTVSARIVSLEGLYCNRSACKNSVLDISTDLRLSFLRNIPQEACTTIIHTFSIVEKIGTRSIYTLRKKKYAIFLNVLA